MNKCILNFYLILQAKLNSLGIKYQNVKDKIIKLEKNAQVSLWL